MPDDSIPFSASVRFNDQPAPHAPPGSEHVPATADGGHATLPCPRVEEAYPADVLNPSDVFETVHLLISYPRMARNDVLDICWHGDNPLGCTKSRLTITDVVDAHPVRLAVWADYVMPNMGQCVRVSYRLWRATTQAYEYSSTLNLQVRELVG